MTLILELLDRANFLLRDSYKATGLAAENVLDMAGTLIDDEIRSMHFDASRYPKFSDLDKAGYFVSPLLLWLL